MNLTPSRQTYKILVIGDSGVGKSCLMGRVSKQTFTDTHISTIGIELQHMNVRVNGQAIRLQLWDTGGLERFEAVTKSYYRGADGVLLVYDVGDQNSYRNSAKWLSRVREVAGNEVELILIGNKSDLDQSLRRVSNNQGEELARSFGVKFYETSALLDFNLELAITDLSTSIYRRKLATKPVKSSPVVRRRGVVVQSNQVEQSSCCSNF